MHLKSSRNAKKDVINKHAQRYRKEIKTKMKQAKIGGDRKRNGKGKLRNKGKVQIGFCILKCKRLDQYQYLSMADGSFKGHWMHEELCLLQLHSEDVSSNFKAVKWQMAKTRTE